MPSVKREAGLSGALARDVEEAGPLLPLADAEQLALGIDAGLDRVQAVGQARSVGRPRGAMNRRSAEFRRWYLEKFPHPLEAMGQALARPVDVLAAELGCSRLEAFQTQMQAARELAPYLEGKMPVAVDVRMASDLRLFIPGINAPVSEDLAEVERMVLEGERIQEDSGE